MSPLVTYLISVRAAQVEANADQREQSRKSSWLADLRLSGMNLVITPCKTLPLISVSVRGEQSDGFEALAKEIQQRVGGTFAKTGRVKAVQDCNFG